MATRRTAVDALSAETSAGNYLTVELFGESFRLMRKFKRLKFLRLLGSDPGAALQLVFAPGDFERLEELDMSDEEFNAILEEVSTVLTGGSKN